MQSSLFKQRKIKGVGEFFNVLYLTLPIISLFGYVGIALTTYATFVVTYIPWLSLPVFLAVAIAVALFAMFLFWKFVYLAYFNNPIGQDVAKIKKKLDIED